MSTTFSPLQVNLRLAFIRYLIDMNKKNERLLYSSILPLWDEAREHAKSDARDKKKAVGTDEIADKMKPLLTDAIKGINISKETRDNIDILIDTYIANDKKRRLGNVPGSSSLIMMLAMFPKEDVIGRAHELCLHAIYKIEINGFQLAKANYKKEAKAAFEIAAMLKEYVTGTINNKVGQSPENIISQCKDKIKNSKLSKHRGIRENIYNALLLASLFGIVYRLLFCDSFWIHTRTGSEKTIDNALNVLNEVKSRGVRVS